MPTRQACGGELPEACVVPTGQKWPDGQRPEQEREVEPSAPNLPEGQMAVRGVALPATQ